MDAYSNVIFEIGGSVARITLSRPDKLNSFTADMHLELRDALRRVRESSGVRVLLLTGAGRGFCAGQDLGDRAVAPGGAAVDLGDSVERFYAPPCHSRLSVRSMGLPPERVPIWPWRVIS